MPNYSSAYDQIVRDSRKILTNLRRQISAREIELRRLHDEEHRLGSLVRPNAAGRRGRRARTGSRVRSRRTDWQALLTKLPKQFKAADIRRVPQVASRRSSEIFAAITRWIEAGTVKRKERGIYQRMK